MTPRDSFLGELRKRTTAHLHALTEESAETFGRYIALPDLGQRVYHRLTERFDMDGAQEIAATLADLFAGSLDTGSVMVTDREVRGLTLVLDEFGPELPDAPRSSLSDLVVTLRKAGGG